MSTYTLLAREKASSWKFVLQLKPAQTREHLLPHQPATRKFSYVAFLSAWLTKGRPTCQSNFRCF